MKIALIGASGFVGTAVLQELVNRSIQVTAIVRHPDKVIVRNELIALVQADVQNENEVVKAVSKHDVVINAFNPGWTHPDLYQVFLKGYQTILAGVKNSGVKRLLVIGGAGSLFVGEGVQLIDTPEFPKEFLPGASAARDYLNIIQKEKELEWTFLSPAIEMYPGTSGVRKGKYRIGLDQPVFDIDGRSIISVEDLAVAIADEVENPQHIKKRFTVAY